MSTGCGGGGGAGRSATFSGPLGGGRGGMRGQALSGHVVSPTEVPGQVAPASLTLGGGGGSCGCGGCGGPVGRTDFRMFANSSSDSQYAGRLRPVSPNWP
eukprot:6482709-Amphidinium_carterae.4